MPQAMLQAPQRRAGPVNYCDKTPIWGVLLTGRPRSWCSCYRCCGYWELYFIMSGRSRPRSGRLVLATRCGLRSRVFCEVGESIPLSERDGRVVGEDILFKRRVR
jgi:hypothetical protein